MTSFIPSQIRSNFKLTYIFAALIVFIGLPVILFLAMAVQGFVSGVGNENPVDFVARDITKSSAVITWHTDKKTQGVIEYGTSPSALNSYAPETENLKEHEVKLTLLAPATTYYLQLRINGNVYDNDGVPWTFTTKTKDGEDVLEAIKGISTRVAKGEDAEATEEAGISTDRCTVTSCEEIQKKLGKGCSAADYFKCISNQTESGTPRPSGYQTYSTPIPTPTVVLIVSNLCKLNYLQAGDSCSEWTWDSFDTKPQSCRNAFNRYVIQCKNTSFTEGSDKQVVWYYNNAHTDISSNSATLKVKPASGERVYCQVRVEDEVGGESHSTPWVRAAANCN